MKTRSMNVYLAAVRHAARLESVALLAARLLTARVFWNSGLAKVETVSILGVRLPTPNIEQSTFQLFQYEFFPDAPPAFTNVAAVAATIGELTLPLLVAFGFLTRFGAFGLLCMTAVIQIFVYPQEWWAVHAWWAVMLLVICAVGPGSLCVDRLIGLETGRRS